jgi:NTE family protein
VNAYSSPAKDWDQRESPPGSIPTAAAAASHTLDRNTWNTLDLVEDAFNDWRAETYRKREIKLYSIYLNFTNFKDQSDQRFFLNLPTSFFLPTANVEKLREAGHHLLRENEAFKQLLNDLRRD